MIFRQLTHDDLGCASYLVGDDDAGVAAVIDPRLDVDEYLRLARYLGVRIEHVLETPLRRVGMAFGVSHREAPGDEVAPRDRLYRQLDNFLANGLSLRQRAEAIRRKRNRYAPRPYDKDAGGERGILWRLHRIGAPDLGERQIRRILGGR